MNAHFFDINSIVTINSKVWIVSRKEPNIPIIKIHKHEFNLIRNGIYKNQNLKIRISDTDYYLNSKLYNNLKIICVKNNIDISNISFSMQEFMNSDIIDNSDFIIHKEHIQHIKNTNDDIYLICSKNTKESYEHIIKKVENCFIDLGISIKNKYFLSETFYNRDRDDIRNNKIKILIQHLIGYKIDVNRFDDVNIDRYDNIYFYDTDSKLIDDIKSINLNIRNLVENTIDENTIDDIKFIIRKEEPNLISNLVTFNSVNLFIRNETPIIWQNIVKTFERFKIKK